MSFALSKIQPPQPRRGLLLARPALEKRLLDALGGHRAVLVNAPAGYGKTALLVRALAQLPPPHGTAWVSLDPGDDLRRLLECLLTALEAFDPPWRVAPEAIIATALQGEVRDRQHAVDDLVNALDACDLAHGVIVLDDVHHLEDEASGHFVQRLLERLGPRWTLVLASRHAPHFSLARIGAAGELTEFRQADLQFTADEVRTLFAGSGIDDAGVAALHARTAGWAAGLRLALSGAVGGTSGTSPAGSAIDRQAFDFLTNEVLARIHPALRAFLLATSVLHDLDEGRCRALTGDARAAAWLDDIERRGLFASVVHEAPRTLRLHDLFREALQHRLRIERGGAVWLELQALAAATEPDPLRRLALLLGAQRHEDAAAELHGIAWSLLFQGGVPALLHLCAQFPSAAADASAEVQLVLGLARWHSWDNRSAERHFARAETLYRERGNTAGELSALSHRASRQAAQGRLRSGAALVQEMRQRRQAAAPAAVSGDAQVATLLTEVWMAVETGAFDRVAPHFAELLQVLEAENRLEFWWLVIPSPRIAACRGMVPLLGRWAAGALAATGEQPLPLHALALLALGWQALLQGRVDEAAAQLQRADASASWTGEHVIARSHAQALRALVLALDGRADEARALAWQRVDVFPAAGYGSWGLWQMVFFAAKVATLCGDVEALRLALQRLDAMTPLLPDTTPAQLRPLLGPRGALAWHEGRTDEAEAIWRDALAHGDEADLFGQLDELRVRLALAARRRGDVAGAAVWLHPLLDAPVPTPRGVVFAGAALRELAAADWQGRLGDEALDALRRWAGALAVNALRGAAKSEPPVPAARDAKAEEATEPGAERRLGPLTGREVEVLGLIARGQSNKLIARALELSPHTVKRHVANLLDKLALTSRSAAAAWYHEQGARLRRS